MTLQYRLADVLYGWTFRTEDVSYEDVSYEDVSYEDVSYEDVSYEVAKRRQKSCQKLP